MKKMMYAIAMATVLVFLTACSKEDAISEAPQFEKLVLSCDTCRVNDVVMLKAPFKSPGSNFYFVEYVCKGLSVESDTKKDASKGIHLGYNEPNLKCRASSEPGTYTVTFMAKVSYTGNKAVVGTDSKGNKLYNTTLYGETNTVKTTLVVTP